MSENQIKESHSCVAPPYLCPGRGRGVTKCLWKLRAMVVKDTCLFVIKKYKGSYACVSPCSNRDHHQLDSNLVAAHIKAIIKAQFTLTMAAMQASVMEKWGYEIS